MIVFLFLNAFDIVAREGAEKAGPLTGSNVPTVIALFKHADSLSFLQLELVVVLRRVSVHGPVPRQQQ